MSDCIFCKLANHEIETNVFFENDLVAAFDDANPQAPVHALIVPKQHFDSICDDVPSDVLEALLAAVPEVAAAKSISETGFRTVINTGKDANQVVKHLHIHILGGKNLSDVSV